jgi:Uma2 family endonuclease
VTVLTAPITDLPDGFRPLTREDFIALAEAGAFGEDVRVELIGGVIVEVPPPHHLHSLVILLLTEWLVLQTTGRLRVAPQLPMDLDPISMPLPDLMVLPLDAYADHTPEQAHLVIEVAKSSLRMDLGEKARRYAAAGVPRYWVVDVDRRLVHAHADPQADGSWGLVRQVRTGVLDAPDVGVAVDLDDLFGALGEV